jgi:hypothetical protein
MTPIANATQNICALPSPVAGVPYAVTQQASTWLMGAIVAAHRAPTTNGKKDKGGLALIGLLLVLSQGQKHDATILNGFGQCAINAKWLELHSS